MVFIARVAFFFLALLMLLLRLAMGTQRPVQSSLGRAYWPHSLRLGRPLGDTRCWCLLHALLLIPNGLRRILIMGRRGKEMALKMRKKAKGKEGDLWAFCVCNRKEIERLNRLFSQTWLFLISSLIVCKGDARST